MGAVRLHDGWNGGGHGPPIFTANTRTALEIAPRWNSPHAHPSRHCTGPSAESPQGEHWTSQATARRAACEHEALTPAQRSELLLSGSRACAWVRIWRLWAAIAPTRDKGDVPGQFCCGWAMTTLTQDVRSGRTTAPATPDAAVLVGPGRGHGDGPRPRIGQTACIFCNTAADAAACSMIRGYCHERMKPYTGSCRLWIDCG
jgi:hypothetical protein